MPQYTQEDVTSFFDKPLTPGQIDGVLTYLNRGIIPPADPCLSCEPNTVRKLISAVQKEERLKGSFPRAQADAQEGRIELHDEFVPESDDETEKPKPRTRKGK